MWEYIGKYTDRIRVPGGWLVRSTSNNGTCVVLLFVKDQDNIWQNIE